MENPSPQLVNEEAPATAPGDISKEPPGHQPGPECQQVTDIEEKAHHLFKELLKNLVQTTTNSINQGPAPPARSW